jgi:glutathione-independent formaldehyde dehydrogenase
MKAIVFKQPNKVAVETVPDPKIEAPTDVLVRITSAGIYTKVVLKPEATATV